MSNEDIILTLQNKLEQEVSDKKLLLSALKSLLSNQLSRDSVSKAREILEKFDHE
ncbi:hypothetical protein SBX64_15885 [Vibrio rhizosphaerae]|uniref:Uncharacterized protein n=1 Tax=Vibrio rhizosphaerae TaxID=398736 RepID=A0ABU4IXL0_9VIBR|nr:hypothetical protein [Vibrio rhizosphaerae]MDW6094019.1 hypothetical protein [Vibrio rhizosphaerae]